MILFPSLDGLRQHTTHRFANLWRIERTDGVTLLFTDHDRAISFNYQLGQNIAGGNFGNPANPTGSEEIYTPVDSVNTSAQQRQGGMQDNNTEVNGIVINSGQITEADLYAGRYREAKVVNMQMDWKFPYAGYFTRTIYYITQLVYTREYWKAQISGVPIWLRRNNGDVYSNDCRFTLYDPKTCKVDPTTFTATGCIITSIITQNEVFTASGTDTTNDVYDYGELTFNSGFNNGLSFDVKVNTGGQISLQVATPFELTVGDTFTIKKGCDHLRGTCLSKFNNIINFGGYPYIPGNDKLISSVG